MASRADIEAGRAFVRLYLRNDMARQLVRALRSAQKQLRNFGQSAMMTGRRIAMAGAAMAAPFALSTRTFASFDDAMREVAGVTQAADDDFARLTAEAKRLGASTSFTASQVALLMAELGRAGFVPKQIETMTGSVLALARATKTEGAQAAGIMGATIRQFSLDARDASHVADVLTAGANKSFNTLESLGESLSKAGPVANDFNLSLEDTVAILGTLGNVGIQGSEAGTSLRRIMLALGADAKKVGKTFGIDLVDPITGDAINVIDALQLVAESVNGLGTSARAAKFEEAFGLRGITGASAIGKNITGTRDLRKAIDEAGGSAEKTAAMMDAGLGGAFRILLSAVEGVQIAIGEALAPTIKKLAEFITTNAQAAIEWVKANKGLIVGLAATAAGVIVLGVALMSLGAASYLASFAIGTLAGMLTFLQGIAAIPIRLAMVGISAATSAVSLLIGLVSGGLTIAWTTAAAIAQAAWAGAAAVLPVAWTAAATVASLAWSAASIVAQSAWAFFPPVLAAAMSGAALVAAATWTSVAPLVGAAWAAVAPVISATWGAFAMAAGAAWMAVAPVIASAWAGSAAGVGAVWAGAAAAVAATWSTLGLAASAIWSVGGAVVAAAWSVGGIVAAAAWSVLGPVVAAAWSAVAPIVAAAWSAVAPIVAAAWTAVVGVVMAAWSAAAAALPGLFVVGIVAGVAALAYAVYALVNGAVARAVEGGRKIGDSLRDGISGAASKVSEIGKLLVSSMREGISQVGSMFSELWRNVSKDALDTFGVIGKALSAGKITEAWPVIRAFAILEWRRISLFAQETFAKFLDWWDGNKGQLLDPVMDMFEKLKTITNWIAQRIEDLSELYNRVFDLPELADVVDDAAREKRIQDRLQKETLEKQLELVDAMLRATGNKPASEMKDRRIAFLQKERARILDESGKPAEEKPDPFAEQRKAIAEAEATLKEALKSAAEVAEKAKEAAAGKGEGGGPGPGPGGGTEGGAIASLAPRGVALTATYSAAAARIAGYQPGAPEKKMADGIVAIERNTAELTRQQQAFLAGWRVA